MSYKFCRRIAALSLMWSIPNLFLSKLFDHFVGWVFLFVFCILIWCPCTFNLISRLCVFILTLSLVKRTFIIWVSIRSFCSLFFYWIDFLFNCIDDWICICFFFLNLDFLVQGFWCPSNLLQLVFQWIFIILNIPDHFFLWFLIIFKLLNLIY